ncbi:MAG TPA: hypothetical protein VGF95_07705 [Solirubrobacteraceae bacterium]
MPFPSNLQPGGEGYISVFAVNRGYEDAEGKTAPIVLTDVLPPGVEVTEVHSHKEPAAGTCTFTAHVASCTYEAAVLPYERVWMVIAVKVAAAPAASEVNEVSVSGGAPAKTVQSALHLVAGEPLFGVESYELSPEEVGGGLATQAGAHPFQLTTTITFNKTGQFPQGGIGAKGIIPKLITGIPMQPALPKDVNVKLPPGLVGNPTPFPQCTSAQFSTRLENNTNECPQNTVVGFANIMIDEPTFFGIRIWQPPVFNLVPEHGEPARFGFTIEGAPVYLDTSVRTGGDYGVTVHVGNISQLATLLESEVVFWGVPGDHRHDISRGWDCGKELGLEEAVGKFPCKLLEEEHPQPLLVMPTSCTGPLQTSAEVDSWKEPLNILTYGPSTPMASTDGCNRENFEPEVSLTPDSRQGSTASGLTVDVHVPQAESLAPTGLSEANVKDTTVTLPEGLVLNPSAADGLLSCSLDQIALESAAAPTCPEAAKVGTVTIHTPLLPEPLTGAAYLAAQDANPFGSLVALYVVAEDPAAGVLVKLAGEVHLSETGQITSTFKETPQLPFEDFELDFFGGARAPLATPAACGSYTTSASLSPWSGAAPVPSSSTFLITSGPDGSPCSSQLGFSPTLTGGMENIQAGEFSPLTTTMSRNDGEQPLRSVKLTLPKGLMGSLTGVELCGEANADAGTCGPNSLIGHTVVSVGIGGDPYSVTGGRVYMTGPYQGAPFGLSIVEPAVAGPFNLGTVVVRAKVEVDPHTAQLTVVTDPSGPYAIPQILDGIPLQIRHVNVTVDREGFTFNPTSCEKMAVEGTLGSADGAQSSIAVPFQVTNCAALPFKPVLTATTKAKHTRKDGAYLQVHVASGSGQADIAKAKVELPKALPSELKTLQKACTEAQFDANPAGCPADSQVGSVVVHTPVIPVPLTGPAYFVSRGAQWPELIMVLQGYGVTVDLAGETHISEAGVTSTTLGAVPDVPFTSFTLTLPEDSHSALAGNGNLCKKTLTMPTSFTGQNGALVEQKVKVKVNGCAATREKKGKSKSAKPHTKKKKNKDKADSLIGRAGRHKPDSERGRAGR